MLKKNLNHHMLIKTVTELDGSETTTKDWGWVGIVKF